MAITSMDGLVAAMAAGQSIKFFCPNSSVSGSNFFSLNTLVSGSFGQLSTVTAYSSGGQTFVQGTTAGQGWPVWTAAGSGLTSYLSRFIFSSTFTGMIAVYDLLWGCSGLNATVTTAQAVSGVSGLPARAPANGSGLELWVVCFTAPGATASNLTVSYTNQSGVSGRTTQAVAAASMLAGMMKPLPLQSGDTGIQSIQSATFSASTGTAGSIGLFVVNRLTTAALSIGNTNVVADFAGTGLPIVSDAAVLLFILLATGGSSGLIFGQADIAQG